MGKLSFMKWYPADWINDTRELSPEAKAAWIDMLCLMWNAPQRGVWKGTLEQFARATGLPQEIAPRVVDELAIKTASVTIRDLFVTIENRRMIKEDSRYKYRAKVQSDYRSRHARDQKVIPKTLDVRSQKPEQTPPRPVVAPPLFPEIPPLKIKREIFVKPDPLEIAVYAKSIGFVLDGQAFFDYYEARGWQYKQGQPMKSWKAAVSTWKRHQNGGNGNAGTNQAGGSGPRPGPANQSVVGAERALQYDSKIER